MNEFPTRKSIRLKNYDYSQAGCYFVTICTHYKSKLLGTMVGGGLCAAPSVMLSNIGKEIETNLLKLPNIFEGINIEPYIIMPNHVHFMVHLTGQHKDLPLHKLVGQFKSYTTKLFGEVLWQRNYYEHIIRNQQEYEEVYAYIINNPAKWNEDKYFA